MKKHLITVLLATGTSIALAQDTTTHIPDQVINDVVITGQYTARSQDNAVQRIEVIDRRKIDAMAAQNLRDVLANSLEVRLSYDPIFGSSLNMQGSAGYGADAKILIDGVPVVGKQNGGVDLSQINLANIERVEIIKGPMSVSYGTDAIAGTINLITKKTVKDRWELGAGSYYETVGTYNVNFSAGAKIASTHAVRLDGFRNFFGGWNRGAGIKFFDFRALPADTTRVQLWRPREQYQGTAQYTYTRKKTTFNYKGNYFYELITSKGAPLAPYYETAFDNYFHTYRKDNALFINSEPAKDKHISFMAAFNAYKRIKKESSNDLTTLSETFNDEAQDTSIYNELNSRSALTTGRSGVKLNYEIGYDINLQWANSTQIDGTKKEMGNYALYGSVEYRPFERFTIRPGLRYGYNTVYDAPLVPSVNFLYELPSHWMLRASYARGFRQPGLKELYFDFVDINHNIHGNTNLRAEYSNNYAVSAARSGRILNVRYKLNASAFYNDVRDLISLSPVQGSTTNEYNYQNIGVYKTCGGQASVDVYLRNLTLGAGSSYIGTYNPESEEYNVSQFSYSPEARGNVTYGLPKYDASVSVFYKYTGRRITFFADENDQPVQGTLQGYNNADISFSKYFLNRQIRISVGCKNLFDVKSIVGSLSGGGAHSSGGGTSAVGMGRYYFLKADLNLSQ
jgi:outer membrane receptor for ferrienterochelin and colicins